MMMHNDPSGVVSLCDRLVGVVNGSTSSMIKQHPSVSQQYHHLSHHHSDSSRSSSVCSSSLSPKHSPSTAPNATSKSTGTAVSSVIASNVLADVDPELAQHVEYELGLSKKNGNGSGTRKNAWGNLSYAELISKAITSSAEQRLTLSEIYDWMIKYVPFFRNKVDRISSAGWKNSIRHNLSLHNRFKRVQSEGTGKSSWWIINPDEKNPSGNSISLSTGNKQPRRRLGQGAKASSVSSTIPPKRLRAPRTTKGSRAIAAVLRLEQQQQQQQQHHHHQHRTSSVQQVQSSDMSSGSVYETQPWSSQLETDNATTHLYEHEVYSTPVNSSTTNSTNNSHARLQSTYPYDDVATNYLGNTSSSNNTNTNTNNNNGDYSYHHFHPPTHTLYQHHHASNYETGSNSGYYHPQQQQQQSVLNDHHSNPCALPIDVYHPTNSGGYSLSQQLDPNDEHIYLHVHSTSSHSSSASLSPPTTSTTTVSNKSTNLIPSSSSGSSSSNYVHPSKSSSSGGYHHHHHHHHPSNGTMTLYSHHHQHLSHYHSHPDIKTLLHLNPGEDDMDDDDDLSTLVHHHHGMIDDHQQLATFFPNNHNHPLHSHHDPSTSILRTVLKRPIVDVYNQQV